MRGWLTSWLTRIRMLLFQVDLFGIVLNYHRIFFRDKGRRSRQMLIFKFFVPIWWIIVRREVRFAFGKDGMLRLFIRFGERMARSVLRMRRVRRMGHVRRVRRIVRLRQTVRRMGRRRVVRALSSPHSIMFARRRGPVWGQTIQQRPRHTTFPLQRNKTLLARMP